MGQNISGYPGNFQPSVSAVIAQGDTESSPINAKGMALVGVMMPPVMTGTSLSFTVGDSEDGFQAQAQATFGSVSNNDTITINGVAITFKSSSPDPESNEVLIGADGSETAANLLEFLEATEDADLLEVEYAVEGAVMTLTAVEHGTAGNSIPLVKSSSGITLVAPGGVLSGGGFRPLYDSSNALISYTIASARAYAINPANFQGLQWFKLKSGSSEAASRTLVCQLKGF